jgi:hypothetical protein
MTKEIITSQSPHPGWSTIPHAEICGLAKSGLTVWKISEQTGVAKPVIKGILAIAGVPVRMGVIIPRGPNSRRFDHAWAVQRIRDGHSTRETAALLGVTPSAVRLAIKEYEGSPTYGGA